MRPQRRLWILALLAAALLAAPAVAARGADIVRTYAGITCTWPANTSVGAVVCWRADGVGLVVGAAKRFVMVRTRAGRILFFRNQPLHSQGFQPLHDKRVFHVETHGGIFCAWTRVGGGAAECARADNHGYVVALTHFTVLVLNEKARTVYVRNQPGG